MAPNLDPYAALRTLVLGDTEIVSLVEDRVYINAIPESVIEAQDPRAPNKMLVLAKSGGAPKADRMPTRTIFINALCYGESDAECAKILHAVQSLFQFLHRETVDGVFFHDVTETGGEVPLVDPDIVWPAVAQGFSILADTKNS